MTKRARDDGTFSMEPDIEIRAGSEVIEAHSIILMMSSPVFRQMLTTNMSESRCGQISLPDKSAAELRCFIDSLSTVTMRPLTDASAIFLAAWAEEYEVLSLKDMCGTSSSTCLLTARACGTPSCTASTSASNNVCRR